jgi:hypothetical protein
MIVLGVDPGIRGGLAVGDRIRHELDLGALGALVVPESLAT